MSAGSETNTNAAEPVAKAAAESEMDPVAVQPGSKADPSTATEWKEHVAEYFNQETTHGEALPTASHEAKQTPEGR